MLNQHLLIPRNLLTQPTRRIRFRLLGVMMVAVPAHVESLAIFAILNFDWANIADAVCASMPAAFEAVGVVVSEGDGRHCRASEG